MEENKIKVYVQVDSNNVITQIESDISSNHIDFSKGWIQIDEGIGEKYAHAQNDYLENSLMDINFKYNYKLVDGKPVELTEEEKEKLFLTSKPEPTPEETLRAKLLKDNVAMQLQLTKQQQINASLLSQIAKLGGTK